MAYDFEPSEQCTFDFGHGIRLINLAPEAHSERLVSVSHHCTPRPCNRVSSALLSSPLMARCASPALRLIRPQLRKCPEMLLQCSQNPPSFCACNASVYASVLLNGSLMMPS